MPRAAPWLPAQKSQLIDARALAVHAHAHPSSSTTSTSANASIHTHHHQHSHSPTQQHTHMHPDSQMHTYYPNTHTFPLDPEQHFLLLPMPSQSWSWWFPDSLFSDPDGSRDSPEGSPILARRTPSLGPLL